MKITEEPSTTYKLRSLPQGGWADITLREWEGGGSFQCQSDFGNFAHVWGSIGPRTLREFLCELDKDYFLKKTRSEDYRRFSVEKSCQQLRKDIIEARRCKDLTKRDARLCWEEVDEIEDRVDSLDDYMHRIYNCSEIIDELYCGDYYGIPDCSEYDLMCDLFWERVWPHITKYWAERL